MWSHWICDTFTGSRMQQVFPSGENWRTSFTGVGSGSHQFQLRDEETRLPRATWQDLATPWARTVVSCWADVPQYAGLIRTQKYGRFTGVLELSTVEIRQVLAIRMPFTVPEYDPNGVRAVIGKSLRGIMRQVLDWGTKRPGSNDWSLPVVLPADESGSQSRSWQMYNFETVEQLLQQIEGTNGGPDLHLRPRWGATGALEWESRIGTLTGPAFEWDSTASEHGLADFTVTKDAAKQLTGVFSIGAGSEADMKVGQSPFTGIPGTRIPNLDATRSFKTLADDAQLDAAALAELQAFREPSRVVTLGALASDVLPSMVLGSTLRAWVEGDEFLDDGWYGGTLVGMSGNLSETIGMEIA
ncbi:hypothetical protein [Microbacterium sp. 8M]|uniref:hypothetical protein n=1 Tax=Microbacterium sp. 8M TaxID=2653153 RepID=UPI0013568C5A|nr:hypothetical protein [Microbacterium sp. 8M]